jgi:hypothetical protein
MVFNQNRCHDGIDVEIGHRAKGVPAPPVFNGIIPMKWLNSQTAISYLWYLLGAKKNQTTYIQYETL